MCGGYLVPNLDGSLDEFSGTWPTWGTLLDGVATELTPSVRHTSEKESLSWRTPQSHNGNQGPKSKEFYERCLQTNESMIMLTDQVRHNPGMWPTPQSFDANDFIKSPEGMERNKKKGGCRNLREEVSGQLNPVWVECLMGFPQGWTDIGQQDGGQHHKPIKTLPIPPTQATL